MGKCDSSLGQHSGDIVFEWKGKSLDVVHFIFCLYDPVESDEDEEELNAFKEGKLVAEYYDGKWRKYYMFWRDNELGINVVD